MTIRLAVVVALALVGCGRVSQSPQEATGGAGGSAGSAAPGTGGSAGSAGRGAELAGTAGDHGDGGGQGGELGAGGATGGGIGGVVLTVELAERDLNAKDGVIAPHLEIENDGQAPLALSDLTIRYWYTEEGTDGMTTSATEAQQVSCDYATVGCTNFTLALVPVVPPRPGANFYLGGGFTADAGSLAPGANTGELQTRITKLDASPYNETDDYSYLASTAYQRTTKVTVYLLGQLVAGVEP